MNVFHNYEMNAGKVLQGTFYGNVDAGDRIAVGSDVLAHMAAVRSRFDQAAGDGLIAPTEAAEIETTLADVEAEVDSETPRRSRLLTSLGHLRQLTAGVAATAGLAEAVTALIGAVGGAA